MLPYNIPASVSIVAAGVSSFLVFATNAYCTREGKIQLPISQGDASASVHVPEHVFFDVVKPTDLLEGYPVEEEAFWRKARLWKILIAILNAAVVVVDSASLGWAAMFGDRSDIASYGLRVVFAIYVFGLSIRMVRKNTAEHSGTLIVHLACLQTFASLILFISAILPDTGSPISTVAAINRGEMPRVYWLTTFLLDIISATILVLLPRGPPLHYPPEQIYGAKILESITNVDYINVTGTSWVSIMDYLMFSYTSKVIELGNTAESVEIGDLPVLPAKMRATSSYHVITRALIRWPKWTTFFGWSPNAGSGYNLAYTIINANRTILLVEILIAAASGGLFYIPTIFMRMVISYIETDPEREQLSWGVVYVVGVFLSNVIMFLVTGQLWSISTAVVAVRIKTQLNSILFKKTLTRKDVAGISTNDSDKESDNGSANEAQSAEDDEDESNFSTKGQIFTLFTTDADRVSDFAWHLFALIDAPIEIVVGTIFLYKLLGVSCLVGLAVTCLFLPMNHWAGKVVLGAQDNLMKKRDQRVALMNEILGAIRMLKFMAWERSFENRVLKIRDEELKYQKLNYNIETMFNFVSATTPIMVTLVSLWHYTVVRGITLTPSVAFTSILVFNELEFALNTLPETVINLLQSVVSLRRIEKYLLSADVAHVPPLGEQSNTIAFRSATVTWPQDRNLKSDNPSAASTPRQKFALLDLNIDFPDGELSLICGKLGSGKTLLLLSLLGEADILTGQVLSPRSPADTLASLGSKVSLGESWIVEGVCAYVPQAAWLRNASIKENILFNLPYEEVRYQKTLEVCALLSDLEIIEDGDEAEIGERGVNLSGGQKARVSLARAVYSRASVLLLDDVLSAVDAHTAHHIYHKCLKGDLMRGRTVVLVSHHVQLCAPDARYIVALDNGEIIFSGDSPSFMKSTVMSGLIQSRAIDADDTEEAVLESNHDIDASLIPPVAPSEISDTSSATAAATAKDKKAPRKLVSEEQRAVGRISNTIYRLYLTSFGGYIFWLIFVVIFAVSALVPVAENSWLRYWSSGAINGETKGPIYYISIYTAITLVGAFIQMLRWVVLYFGSISASVKLYKGLLESVLFANIRFHDTVSRGRLLNRFGKDFEDIDSDLADNFGRAFTGVLSSITTLVTIAYVGGPSFIAAAFVLACLYYKVGSSYGQASRDMRRLDSVTRSPLYSLYGETISGVAIVRAFGASSKFLRDMLLDVNTNITPHYWMWGVNRWLALRFNMLSSLIIGLTAAVCLLNKNIDSALAGFALTFASSIVNDIFYMVRRFVNMEQSMVALERVKEYTDLPAEGAEFVEPRPAASWPENGEIQCENLVIKYAPDLPDVLHNLSFNIKPGEKVGILGRTGSGKSTLALSLFRFVEASEGRILIDGQDISQMGLSDLRSRLTIIPQDPTILSGTLRSTLDIFNEYEDSNIFEALRRVHLIQPLSTAVESNVEESVNLNVFKNLESPVSEGGENFSTGEKQLICMARAILRRSKVLVMDEATASVDYATDELISRTIRQEFSNSTILTIAHRLRTVIDYDRVMLLDQGQIVEFDKPSTLLKDSSSQFYSLCKATGKEEFAMLKKLANGQ
ncbi:multidrug resistance-associated ABC transporter [Flagelloscypha sp. PMI_526]|nr:multidrug resistance-associated ABC transporter [Flagelloscypha sp. PMI_526]